MIDILQILILVTFGWLLSGAIHELGHVIVGKMAGLNIDYIQILPPGVRFSGETSKPWLAALSIAGPLLPALVGVAGDLAVVFLKEEHPNVVYAVWVFLPMLMHSLALLYVPVAGAFGIRAPDNDVTRFIALTEWPSFLVSLIGLLLVGLCGVVLKWAL